MNVVAPRKDMKMTRIVKIPFAILILALLNQSITAQDKPHQCPKPEVVKDSKFVPGQIWEYKTRQNEESSIITILKVESLPKLGTIIHVRVDKIRLRNCTGGPEPNKLEHMPFAREAIEHSVTRKVKEGSVPDFKEGYEEWRKACGGVYTITVADALNVSEATFRKGLGCETEN